MAAASLAERSQPQTDHPFPFRGPANPPTVPPISGVTRVTFRPQSVNMRYRMPHDTAKFYLPRHPWGAVSGARNHSASAILAVVDSDGIAGCGGAPLRCPNALRHRGSAPPKRSQEN